MVLNCGIVGLPNVGKSTLFNALTRTAAAQAENYPFCTIEPNIGRVPVPDPRLDRLAELAKSGKVIPNTLECVDIAGLVRGASKGEGLGNQFLGHIRAVDAILHVLRCFEHDDIAHVEGSVDPVRDAETVETELMLADLASLERRREGLVKRSRSQDKEAKQNLALVDQVQGLLEKGKPARLFEVADQDRFLFKQLQLLTAKPILYICNVNEEDAVTGNAYTERVQSMAEKQGAAWVVISAAIEAEVSQLEDESERLAFLQSLGLQETGLSQVIHAGFCLLDLITFFTIGPKEAHAWTVPRGSTAPQAAGQIHTDFEKGFICAETINYKDYIAYGGENKAKEAGKMHLEGRDYIVQDGDVFHFRFNV